MLFRALFSITVLLGFVFILLFIQPGQATIASSARSKGKLPSLLDEEASQWLSARPSRRWRHQRINQPSSEVDQSLKQLQALNDNGIRQYDTQSFEGVSMEVIFEMVYKQQNNAVSG